MLLRTNPFPRNQVEVEWKKLAYFEKMSRPRWIQLAKRRASGEAEGDSARKCKNLPFPRWQARRSKRQQKEERRDEKREAKRDREERKRLGERKASRTKTREVASRRGSLGRDEGEKYPGGKIPVGRVYARASVYVYSRVDDGISKLPDLNGTRGKTGLDTDLVERAINLLRPAGQLFTFDVRPNFFLGPVYIESDDIHIRME